MENQISNGKSHGNYYHDISTPNDSTPPYLALPYENPLTCGVMQSKGYVGHLRSRIKSGLLPEFLYSCIDTELDAFPTPSCS